MATYKPILHHRTKKDGTRRIVIQVTKNRVKAYVATDFYIHEKYWNKNKAEVKASLSLHEVYNQAIRKNIRTLQEIEAKRQIEGAPTTAKEIKYYSTKTIDFIAYYEQRLAIIKIKLASTTHERYFYSFEKLKKYIGKQALPFSKIDINWLEGYYAHLLTNKNNTNTANKELETISGLIKKAIAEGYIQGYLDPFVNFNYKKVTVHKDRLNAEEIEAIEALTLSGNLDIYRDVFLFEFYAAGLRITDALSITISNIKGHRLEYIMHKTNKKRSLLISGKMETIIKKYSEGKTENQYLFPLLKCTPALRKEIESKTSSMNLTLKEIAKAAKIDKKITTHTARHSFADIARRKTKDIYSISKALGHSDISITQAYLSSLDMGENDEFITSITG